MRSLSDYEAVQKIKAGEIDHFSLIVKKYTPPIHRYINSKLFNKLEVDDLVQNCFISFYKAIADFDESRPVLPYLYEIAKNELKMYYRSHKSTLPLKEEIVIEEAPQEVAFDKSILNALNAKDKNILLALAEGYSYEEISEKNKIPINTLKSKVRRARIKLKLKTRT